MKRNLQGFAAAGSLFLAMCAAEAAFAQKPGGVLKIYHRDSPASMSILEEATNSTEIPMMGVFNNLVPISKAALVPSAGEHFENPGKSGLSECSASTSTLEMGMKALILLVRAATCAALSLIAFSAVAADYPTPQEGDWVAGDFRFHTGEVMPDLRLHYTTVGAPSGQPVLILHGTAQSGTAMLSPVFAAELFGQGQPLDASKYYIILPDIIGHGKSAKPSDGLRAKFPHYNYDDMVAAQYRLVSEGLGLRHLRLVLGFSMGGMQTWVWGVKYPDFMDALVPMASLPAEMSSRNWMMRRLITDGIRNDPEWNNGNYMVQPRAARVNSVFYGIATNGGTLAYQKSAPTREAADKLLNDRLAAPFTADANDVLYQWDASGDYNPAPGLERIQATVLAINSADDEKNPPETGIMERELKRVKGGRLFLIPGSEDTSGHGTVFFAKFWKQQVQELLQTTPRRAM